MKRLLANINIKVDDKIYLKDPETSEIGRNIIKNGILLIDELGLESFTFRKLAERIGSTEATIYRYFESKHKLLIYLISWYWSWQEYRLMFAISNIESAETRLKIAIRILSGEINQDMDFAHIDEETLQRIVVAESAKAYLTKGVDIDNKEGFFLSYKRFCRRIADLIREFNPDYPYPASLVSTLAESAHYQKFFARHLPSLTNIKENSEKHLEDFLLDLTFKTISR
ncbi:TetR/AcrR family transcriptional regulator [Cesiribacter sp. SM1]|uniref:TetR/AcrR family transcriptional regulator n=1 Tax=Cesiribacter sp. SM1 TaxID=2861196 RepID=UPI001CD4F065|nr:TetR/AcrR family transcriptional regulator [Cesiribacter sp. SM1]